MKWLSLNEGAGHLKNYSLITESLEVPDKCYGLEQNGRFDLVEREHDPVGEWWIKQKLLTVNSTLVHHTCNYNSRLE